MERRLRILFVLHLPWTQDLGGSRIQVELADALIRLGHHVDHFSLDELGTRPARSRLGAILAPTFASVAVPGVARIAGDYDVIDALEGCLPVGSDELDFKGLLVCRSLGLSRHYRDFEATARRRWPEEQGRALARPLRAWEASRRHRNAERSIDRADLLMVPNADEKATLRAEKPDRDIVVLPYGLTPERREAFGALAADARTRLDQRRLAFIGYWQARKGRRDWPFIARQLLEAVGDVTFRFLGTGADHRSITAELGIEPDRVEVVPTFRSEELPELLADCTAAAFPSYIEGFGFAVLEGLAAGLPVMAYDVPGPREMLRAFGDRMLVAAGDSAALAGRLGSTLQMPLHEYAQLSAACSAVADDFQWPDIAAATARAYRVALAA